MSDLNWKIVGVGDFDGNGTSDILWRNSISGENSIWNDGDNTSVTTLANLGDQNWKVVGTGDYNGDGQSDILWRNSSTGENSIWKSANSANTLSVDIQADQNWQVVDGLESGDLLQGGTGNNTLYGTMDNDVLTGGAGNDTYLVSGRANTITELTDEGIDHVLVALSWTLGANLENLSLAGNGNFSATGNAFGNQINGNDGNNILDGGTGADTLIGGDSNDTYVVDNANDLIVETADFGIDSVRTFVSLSLGENLEDLTLLGTKNLNGNGNDLDNALTGNGGNNTLNGGAGNDLLNGASGNDTLTGSSGNDTFAFTTPLNAARNVDVITDFVSGADKIQLASAIFKQIGFTGIPDSDTFLHTGSAAHDANDRIVYDQSNGALYYDADGTGALAAVQFALLNSMPNLQYTDFVVG